MINKFFVCVFMPHSVQVQAGRWRARQLQCKATADRRSALATVHSCYVLSAVQTDTLQTDFYRQQQTRCLNLRVAYSLQLASQ